MPQESPLFEVETHLARVRACAHEWRGMRLPTATPEAQRYPLVYPRDTAAITRAWDRLVATGDAEEEEAADALRGAADFLLAAQGRDGLWGQRYDLDARDRSLYPQEDNVAHAVAILARHVRRERAQGRENALDADAMAAIARALAAAEELLLSVDLGLFWSTTSVHESALERGYTLWTNGAFYDALRLAADAARACGWDDQAAAWTTRRERLGAAMRARLVHEGTFVRRVTPGGCIDERPDITLLSPTYFGFAHLDPQATVRAQRRVEAELRDDDLGLPRRYLPEHDDMTVHLHGGDGPYLSFSAWLAQAHAAHDEPDRAWEVLRRIASFASEEGHLPEHVATTDSFERFMRREWLTGLDMRKEFDSEILLPGVTWRDVLEEGARMTQAYQAGVEAAEIAGDGVVRNALPHAWAHAEFALALAVTKRAQS